MKSTLLNGLNTFLMWNTFFVLLSFVWFVAALVGRSFDVPLGFNLWIQLWDPIFTPAIGLLMGGAIISGIYGWFTKRLTQSKS
jgi:hypothetical protein